MHKKRHDAENLRTIGKVIWDDFAAPLMITFALMAGITFIFLPVLMKQLIPSPVKYIMPLFTMVTIAHVWLSIQYTKKYLVHRRLVGYPILSWVLTLFLVGFTVWAYIGN